MNEIMHLAHRAYQEETWFGKGDRISSPEEIYEGILGDYDLHGFVEQFADRLTAQERAVARALAEVMAQNRSILDADMDFREVLDDPRWVRASAAAQRFLDVFNLRQS